MSAWLKLSQYPKRYNQPFRHAMKALIARILLVVILGILAAPECVLGQAAEPAQLAPYDLHHWQPQLPDPLLMSDGRRVTTPEQWFGERRPELIALFQRYMYGFLPPAPANTTGTLEREDRTAFDGKAVLKEVTVRFGPPQLRPMHLMLVIPNNRQGPAPVILGMNYFGNHTLVKDRAVMLSTNWMPERGEGVVNNWATEASRGTWVDIWQMRTRSHAATRSPHSTMATSIPTGPMNGAFKPITDSWTPNTIAAPLPPGPGACIGQSIIS